MPSDHETENLPEAGSIEDHSNKIRDSFASSFDFDVSEAPMSEEGGSRDFP